MSTAEAILLWSAVALYVGVFLGSLFGVVFRRPRALRGAERVLPAALALHLGAGLARWAATGHAPVMYAYENGLSGSFFVAAIYAGLAWRVPAIRKALPAAIAVVLLILGDAITSPRQLAPLEPPFRSGWLVVHVSFAWFAFGAYLVASVVAGLCLWSTRRGAPAPTAGDAQAARRPLVLDESSGRLIAFGFAADTIMIASGAIWAHGLWGRYWAWDPVETWSLVSWLIYGANLHLRFTLGWNGRRAAWLALASVVAVVITFFGIGVVSDVHTELL